MAILGAHGRVWPGLLLLACLGLGSARADAPPVRETQLKAVFLFNFAQFVDWPGGAFATPDAPLVIGVLGEDPFGEVLDEVVRGERVGGRPLVVRRFRAVEEVDQCHLLFVGRSEAGRAGRILAALKGRPVLTVADMEDFAVRGGMIRFVTDRGRIRFRINLEAAKDAGLVLSSKLLRPAEIVGGGRNGP